MIEKDLGESMTLGLGWETRIYIWVGVSQVVFAIARG